MTDLNEPTAIGAAAVTGRELLITRLLPAPRDRVFEAWADPDQLTNWWGPDGFTINTETIDVRPGGIWRYLMHGPDGESYQNEIRYRVVLEPQRLEYSHGSGEENDPDQFEVTVSLSDSSPGTKLTITLLFPTVAERAKVVEEYGADENVNQTLDRLVDHLETMPQE